MTHHDDRPAWKLVPSLALVLAAVLLTVWALPPAHAEDGEGSGAIEEKIKKKMQEILKLMQENEEILLRVSTGASGKPRRVDVDVPQPPSKKGGAASKGGGSSGGGDGAKGEEIARKMRELIEGQRSSGGKIPGEIGRLLKMIPKKEGRGRPQQGGKGEKQKKEEQDARDARKKLDQKNESEPKSGEKSPKNPADRVPKKGGKPEDFKDDGSKRDDNVPPWAAALPPEIRDALAGGRAEDVPSKYRHLIKRYHLWLQKNRKP